MILLQSLMESNDIESHLKERGLDPSKTHVIMDKKDNIAVFLLYNLSGQLVGYQRYNPSGQKTHSKDKLAQDLEKYYTYVTKEGKVPKLAVWGLETIKESTPFFFITEGIFDCIKIHNAGYPGIAVLANNPKPLRGWFAAMHKVTIAITDNDAAGAKLKNLATMFEPVPSPYKDLGEMPQAEATKFIKSVVKAKLHR